MGGAKSTYLRPEFDVRERVREAEQTGVLSLVGAGAPNFPVDLLRKVSALESLDLTGNPIKTLPSEVRRAPAALRRGPVSHVMRAFYAFARISGLCAAPLREIHVR